MGGAIRVIIDNMYHGMKCRFALAIIFREKRSFCPQKTEYRPILRGIFYDSSFFNNHLAWPDPIPNPSRRTVLELR